MADDKAASLQSELEQAKKLFKRTDGFQDKRRLWDRITHRDLSTELPPELTGDQEGLDYQSPLTLKFVRDHIDVLNMTPSVYDVIPLDEGSKDKARDILMWTARGWEVENGEDEWWDRTVAEGQVRHGVKVMALRWHEQKEPKVDEKADAEEQLKQRNEAFKKRKHPFYWHDCDIYGCYWIGDERSEFGPDAFYYEYEIPYIEAQHRFKSEKGKFYLTEAGKCGYLGESEAIEGQECPPDRKITVLVRDARDLSGRMCPLDDCEHPQRVISIFCKYEGSEDYSDDNKVEEYDSPFPGCSYFPIGGQISFDRDPHFRFSPLMLPIYVEATWYNYMNTLLATIGRTDYSDEYFYIDLSKVPPHVQLPEGGAIMEVERPEPGSGKLPMYPGPVSRFPKSMSPHLLEMLKQSQIRMDMLMPNRFLNGSAYQEASNATGTAFIQQAQQAALPYNTLLANSDHAQTKSRRYEYHAIKYWAKMDPADAKTRYYAVTTGNTEIVKTARTSSKVGQLVYVDADKLSMNFDLRVRTKSETLAEEGARWLQAKDQHMYGVLTDEQLLRAAGVDDIEGQVRALRVQDTKQDIEPLAREMRKRLLVQRASVRTGFDFGMLTGQPVFAPGGGVPMQQGGAPMDQGPRASNVTQAPQNNSATAAPNSIMGRSIQQATIEGPDSGPEPFV